MIKRFFQSPYGAMTFLVLFVFLFFGNVIFGNKTLKSSTTIAQALPSGPYGQENNRPSYIPYTDNTPAILEEPYQEFKKHTFSKFSFPLWNPHQACGMPFFAGGQSAVLFPLGILLYMFPEIYAWDIYILVQILIAGMLTFAFMRLLGYPHVPSITAAVAYMFSGPIITWMVNVGMNTSMLLPLLFITAEILIQKPGLKTIIFSAFAVGWVVLSGHPEHIAFSFLTVSLYFMLRIIFLKNENAAHHKFKTFQATLLALLLGFLLSAVFLLPFIEYVQNSWTSHDALTGVTYEDDITQAITILVPYFFQKELLTYSYQKFLWYGGYLGIMISLMAWVGILKKNSNKHPVIFGCLAFFVISKCYGIWPVNLIGYLPVLNKLRFELHYTQDFAFAMAVLAGIGLQRLSESKTPLKNLLVPVSIIVLILVFYLSYFTQPQIFRSVSYVFILLVLVLAIAFFVRVPKILALSILLLLVAELFFLMPSARSFKYPAFPKTPYIEFLKKQTPRGRAFGLERTFFPNTATAFGVDDLGIYEGLIPQRFVRYVNEFISPGRFRTEELPTLRIWLEDFANPFLDLANLRFLIAPAEPIAPKKLDPKEKKLIYSHEVNIYERLTAFPRAFIVPKALFATDQNETISLLKSHRRNLREIAIMEGPEDPLIQKALTPVSGKINSSAEIQQYDANYVKIRATSDHPGFLILSDTYFPGWKATVDGKKAKIYIADLMFRGVFIEKGSHIIEFHYRPLSFIVGAILSLLTFLGLVLTFLNSCKTKRLVTAGGG
ncbi:MAG TPA: YfhO family protein [Candidatus Omnitrophota bacterium]|nr:YfhO family protein [Candidatus Omnitrophota bacterium]